MPCPPVRNSGYVTADTPLKSPGENPLPEYWISSSKVFRSLKNLNITLYLDKTLKNIDLRLGAYSWDLILSNTSELTINPNTFSFEIFSSKYYALRHINQDNVIDEEIINIISSLLHAKTSDISNLSRISNTGNPHCSRVCHSQFRLFSENF